MAVQETSVKAYLEIIGEGLLNKMEEKVLTVIKENPYKCDRELAEISGLRINQITARRNSLVANGCVIDCGTQEDPITKRTVHIWKVPIFIYYKAKQPKKQENRTS